MSGYKPNETNGVSGPKADPARGDRPRKLSPALPLTDKESSGNKPPTWTAESWENPMMPDHSYTSPTWDEAEYLPNDPSAGETNPRPQKADDMPAPKIGKRAGNPYTHPTWDEENYLPGGNKDASPESSAFARHGKQAALHFDADADTSPNGGEAQPSREPETEALPHDARSNPYARPTDTAAYDSTAWSERYAPPLKFNAYTAATPEPETPPPAPNVYRTHRNTDDIPAQPHGNAYRVEQDASALQARKRRKRILTRILIVLLVLIALAIAAYVERDWVFTQLKKVFGNQAVESVQQSVDRAAGTEDTQVTGYDPAPALQVGDKAKKGINAVAGSLGLKTYTVTDANVIARIGTGTNTYDYYLFSATDGKLLGYYEGLPEDGFLVCPNDVYYVTTPPYLINAKGRALIDTTRFSQSVGTQPVLGPMINGWALLSDAAGTSFNFVNADGNALSPLWFAKAFPFTADSTLAYVDTGNVTDPKERYALYELTRSGGMKMWKHTADTSEVLGCADGIACLSDGRLILLDGQQTELCQTDDASDYADCGALVIRDTQTGKYGLFVNGARHYDSVYDSITPVATSKIHWRQESNDFYKQYTVSGMPYPLPLSHYFVLKKGDSEEMVALSTASVYPLLLTLQP